MHRTQRTETRNVQGHRYRPASWRRGTAGVALWSDFIEPMGITRYRVAKALGVQQRRIAEGCAGERDITADTAVRLA